MTRIVQALEQEGLVRRERDVRDGRVQRVDASAKGRRVMQRGRERRITNLAALLERLTRDEIERIGEAAELVERALAQQP